MHFRTLGITLLVLSNLAFAQGRKPAVEDFVGIEVEHVSATPQGAEGLFNLEKDINQLETANNQLSNKQTHIPEFHSSVRAPWSASGIMGVAFILFLPILTWLLVMNHLRQKASIESASNVEVLEKYRRERELARKAADQSKKAS